MKNELYLHNVLCNLLTTVVMTYIVKTNNLYVVHYL